MNQYALEKWVWTEKDFKTMGWHDVIIYGLQLNNNLALDIDYIFQWNQPEIDGFYFTYWIAPSTLIFQKPKEMSFELIQSLDDGWLEIEAIEMESIGSTKRWRISTRQGDISFNADSFRQIIRKMPSFQFEQSIPYDERGGVSFDLTIGEMVKEAFTQDIIDRKAEDVRLYEIVKKRFILNKELVQLSEQRDFKEVNTKDYLKEKKNIKARIDVCSSELRDTRFEGW